MLQQVLRARRHNEARRARHEAGFTLIELLVVIVILGILSAVVVFAVQGTGDKGQLAAAATDAKTLRTAQEAFCGKFGHYATDTAALKGAGFLSPDSPGINSIETAGVSGPCGPGTDPAKPSGFRIVCTVTASQNCAGSLAGGSVVRGGTIVVQTGTINTVLNPATTTAGASHPQSEPMFNGLLAFNEVNAVVPDLAAAMPVISAGTGQAAGGGQDVTFTLRSGMTWHNGTPIIADDVKFTFDEALLRYHARTQASMGPALGTSGFGNAATIPPGAVTLPDGPTGLRVRFHFLYPYSPLLRQMNVTEAPIIPKNVYNDCSVAVMGSSATLGNQTGTTCAASRGTTTTGPVGSGPFKWVSGQSLQGSESITLFKNPTYFKPGLPYLDKLVLLNVATGGVAGALSASRSTPNSLDVGSPAANTLGSFSGGNYAIAQVPRGSGGGNCITTLSFNLWAKGQSAGAVLADPGTYNHPILKTLAVRKAVYQAWDEDSAFANIDFSQGRKADSPFHSALPSYVPQPTLPTFNVDQARAGLQAAGWIDPSGGSDFTQTRTSDGRPGLPGAGTPLALDVIHFETGTQATYAQQLVANLRQVGIALTSRPGTSPVTQGRMLNRDFDTTFVSYCAGDDPVIGVRRQYHSTQIQAVPFTNTSGFREPKAAAGDGTMDDLWDRAVADPAQYAGVQTKAVNLLPMVWMTETLNSRVSRTVCGGLNNQNTGLFIESAYCAG